MGGGSGEGGVASYSLWVMPQGPLAEKLQRHMDALAAARSPSAPTFRPHVTLLGGIHATEQEVVARAQALAAQLKPYRLEFDRVASGAIFHQCVYLLCSTTPEAMQAGAATREAYGKDPGTRYMPHLSLLYSNIDGSQREAVAAEEQQLLLEGPDALLGAGERGFNVDRLTVWHTEEGDATLKSWQQVAELPLNG